MPQEKLRIIAGPKGSGPWFRNRNAPPLYTGEGNVDYVCGKLRGYLGHVHRTRTLGGIEVTCRACDAINKFPLG